MNELELEYDPDVYQMVINGEKSMESFFEEIFDDSDLSLDNSVKAQICGLLARRYSDYKGSPHIEDFEFTNIQNDSTTNHGTVRFDYTINFWFGCSGATTHKDGHEYIKFIIDELGNQLALLFPDVEVRSTYEEF
jgi:hypothetical protein